MTRREQILKLKAQLELLRKDEAILTLRINAIKAELSSLVFEGFRAGEKLLDMLIDVK